MEKVILYTTHCPQCTVLKTLLDNAGIAYDENTDVKLMRKKGFLTVPKLQVDEQVMDMKEAMQWIEQNMTQKGEV